MVKALKAMVKAVKAMVKVFKVMVKVNTIKATEAIGNAVKVAIKAIQAM